MGKRGKPGLQDRNVGVMVVGIRGLASGTAGGGGKAKLLLAGRACGDKAETTWGTISAAER